MNTTLHTRRKFLRTSMLGAAASWTLPIFLEKTFFALDAMAADAVTQAVTGKDGTIRHVMSGLSPQGVQVKSFKAPSPEELGHDFLWRIHQAAPRHGFIGIFNRSQYEDVLVVRVHGLVPRKVWKARYEQINRFEKMLVDNGTIILKFFLHISKGEQKNRLEERLRVDRFS